MPVEQLFPRKPGLAQFLGNLNVDTRFPGRVTPAFDHLFLGGVADGTDLLQYCCGTVIETTAPSSSGANPRQYTALNKSVYRLDNGTITDDTSGLTGSSFANVVQDMVVCISSGAGSLAAGSTEPILLVTFGDNAPANGSGNKGVAFRHLDTDTSPWEYVTDAGTASATLYRVCKSGPDLYGVCDNGRTVLGDWNVSVCPAGNDPTLAASWGNGVPAGSPEWAILSMVPLNDSVVVGKPDGMFVYDQQTKRFWNVLPHLEKAPHPANGKVMAAVANGVIYTTHDCKAYFFDSINVTEITPLKGISVPRDVGANKVTAIADNGETVAMATDCWWNTTQQCGTKVIKVDGAGQTATDLTADVIDGNLQTPASANMNAWGANATDYLYVGADVPIEAIVVRVTRNPNAAAQYFGTPQYSNGSGFTAFTAIVDASVLVDAAATGGNLNITGFPMGNSSAVITWTNINAFDVMRSQAVNFGGSVGSLTKYWVRFPRGGSVGMTATTTIDEVEIVPARAGIPVTAANDFSHRDRAGGITHVYLGTRSGTSAFTWHDVYAVHTYGGVYGMAWHSGRIGQATGQQNMAQSLILWGRWRRVAISESPTRDPVRTIAPRLVQYGTTKPGPLLNLTPLGTVLEDQTRAKQINGFYYDCEFLQPTDVVTVYGQWDQQDIFEIGRGQGGPGFIKASPEFGKGRRLYCWVAITDTAVTDLNAPRVTGIWVDYDYVGDQFDFAQDAATATPERT